MAKAKLLRPTTIGQEGSLAVANQYNAMLEDLARNSGWMELAQVGGFTLGDVIAKGHPVRLSELTHNNVPFETGKDDPIAVVTRCLEGSRNEFFGLTMDEFQAGHFTLSRILLWGRLEVAHTFPHGGLVYLDSNGPNLLGNSPFQSGEKPIGEWLRSAGFTGIHLRPSTFL